MITTAERQPGPPAPRTIERAFSVLEAFTIEASSWRTSDLAAHCDLPVPTVHRILGVLKSYGYLIRDPATREYELGPAAASLVQSAATRAVPDRRAMPVLRSVWSATGEQVTLSALSDSRLAGVEIAGLGAGQASPGADLPPMPRRRPRRSGPLHAGASFKLLLAHMPAAEVEALTGRALDPVGPGSITDPARLRTELAAIRRRRWAFSREEVGAGRWAIAVPVGRRDGTVAAALAVDAPLARLAPERAREHLAVLIEAAQALGRHLSSSPAGRPAEINAERARCAA